MESNMPNTMLVTTEVCRDAKATTQTGNELTPKSREAAAAKAMTGIGHCPTVNSAIPPQPPPKE